MTETAPIDRPPAAFIPKVAKRASDPFQDIYTSTRSNQSNALWPRRLPESASSGAAKSDTARQHRTTCCQSSH